MKHKKILIVAILLVSGVLAVLGYLKWRDQREFLETVRASAASLQKRNIEQILAPQLSFAPELQQIALTAILASADADARVIEDGARRVGAARICGGHIFCTGFKVGNSTVQADKLIRHSGAEAQKMRQSHVVNGVPRVHGPRGDELLRFVRQGENPLIHQAQQNDRGH